MGRLPRLSRSSSLGESCDYQRRAMLALPGVAQIGHDGI